MNYDYAKSLAEPHIRQERKEHLHEPRIAPLTEYVDRLRVECGTGKTIPYFDPYDGGIDARCLFLFEAAGPKAKASGFISRNNNDDTAKNFFKLNNEADLDRKLTASWNIVPWYLGDGNRIRGGETG